MGIGAEAIRIVVDELDDHFDVSVFVMRDYVGGGTAPTVHGALDVAMDVLYGTKNDWLNGDKGALSKWQ